MGRKSYLDDPEYLRIFIKAIPQLNIYAEKKFRYLEIIDKTYFELELSPEDKNYQNELHKLRKLVNVGLLEQMPSKTRRYNKKAFSLHINLSDFFLKRFLPERFARKSVTRTRRFYPNAIEREYKGIKPITPTTLLNNLILHYLIFFNNMKRKTRFKGLKYPLQFSLNIRNLYTLFNEILERAITPEAIGRTREERIVESEFEDESFLGAYNSARVKLFVLINQFENDINTDMPLKEEYFVVE